MLEARVSLYVHCWRRASRKTWCVRTKRKNRTFNNLQQHSQLILFSRREGSTGSLFNVISLSLTSVTPDKLLLYGSDYRTSPGVTSVPRTKEIWAISTVRLLLLFISGSSQYLTRTPPPPIPSHCPGNIYQTLITLIPSPSSIR